MIDQTRKVKAVSLSEADRLELIGVLWDSLSHHDLPVTEGEQALLDERLAQADAHPEDESPWSEVKTRLEQKLSG